LVGFQHFDHFRQMRGAGDGLAFIGEFHRCAHFLRQGRGNVVPALVIFREDGPQQVQPLGAGGGGEGGEGGFGGGNRPVHVGGATDGDFGESLFGGRIDHVQQGRADRVNPGAIDEKLAFVLHGDVSLWSGLQSGIGFATFVIYNRE